MKDIKTIELAYDLSCAEQFAEWLKGELPYADISIGESDRSLLNGRDSTFCGDNRLKDLWELWMDIDFIFEVEPDCQQSRAIIHHEFDGEFWSAECDQSFKRGFGYTPEQATASLWRMIAGRKMWRFAKLEPDFSELHISPAIIKKLVENGVYTTQQLKSMSRLNAKLLDVMINAKGRVLEWLPPRS